MKKHWYIYLLVAVVLIASGFGIGYFWTKSNEPVREVVESKQAMEVYEEFPIKDISLIKLDVKNENIRIALSDNQYVRIVYQPSTDGLTFRYSLDNGTLSLSVGEVETNTLLIPEAREMIYLYLPKNTSKNINIKTESGFIDVDEVSIGTLEINTNRGIVNITDCFINEKMTITSISGTVYQRNTRFTNEIISSTKSNIFIKLTESLENYSTKIQAGEVYLNEVKTDNLLTTVLDSTNLLHISSGGGVVKIKETVNPKVEEK